MATHDSDPPQSLDDRWYSNQLQADGGNHHKDRTRNNQASGYVLENTNNRTDHSLIQNRSYSSQVGFGTIDGSRPVCTQTLERGCGRPYERGEQSHDSYFDGKRVIGGQLIAPDSSEWLEIYYQQADALLQNVPTTYSHNSEDDPLASSEMVWAKPDQSGSASLRQRLVFSEGIQDNRDLSVVAVDDGPENAGRRTSLSTSIVESIKPGMFIAMEVPQTFPNAQSGSHFKLNSGPWSAENRRRPSTQTSRAESLFQAGSPETNDSGPYGQENQSSATSLGSDNDTMMRSLETVRGPKLVLHTQSQSTEQYSIPDGHDPSTLAVPRFTSPGTGYHFEIDEGTPQPSSQPDMSSLPVVDSSTL